MAVRVWLIALFSVLVGMAAAAGGLYLEFAGISERFEPSNRVSSTSVPQAGTEGALPDPKAVVVGGSDYDFGSGQRDAKLTHEFVIRNEGQGPLKLEKGSTSCKCAVSELTQGEVPPGGTATVKLEWTLKTTSTKFRQTAEIHTNDPALPTILLAVEGKVLDLARADPKEIVLSNVSASEGGHAQFRVYGYRQTGLEISQHEFTNQDLASYFELAFQPLSAEELQNEDDAKCGLAAVLRIKPGLPLGPINQTIRLKTNVEGAQDLEVSVTGSVVSDIAVVGPHVFDEERNVVRWNKISRSEGAVTNLHLLIKGPHRHEVRLTLKEIDPADVLAATLGEPKQINEGVVVMYPLEVAVRKDSRPIDRLGGTKDKLGKIVIETTHPDTKLINVYVRFAVE